MNNEKELSDLKLDRKECPKCGAVWLNGTHIWRGTGATKEGSELDLAGLVCNQPWGGGDQCINPMKGRDGGDTWKKRLNRLDAHEEDYTK